MTPTTAPSSSRSIASRPIANRSTRSSLRRPEHALDRRRPAGRRAVRGADGVLGRYVDSRGRRRELLARPGQAGSVLVLDRDIETRGDRRLVAHLAADEPPENARLICRHYLQDPRGRWCRPATAEDFRVPCPASDGAPDSMLEAAPVLDIALDPMLEAASVPDIALNSMFDAAPASTPNAAPPSLQIPGELVDRHGRSHCLERVACGLSIPELRWVRNPPRGEAGAYQPVSMREVVACLESYEPVRAHTVAALAPHGADRKVSVAVLRAELERLDASRIVLNRGLRLAVLSALRTQGLSMSEVAIRCGRIKYDSKGNASGETSWLARRVGISPEGGESAPTPWIHSEVLALIARAGLGISPREVELG